MPAKFQSSVLFVKDIHRSRQFYEGLLEQKILMDHGLNVGFEGGFALWQNDHAHQTIFGSVTGEPGPSELGHKNFELYFETDDLETLLARVEKAQTRFVHRLHEQPWGQRVFRIYDLDGHVVEFGEPMPVVILRLQSGGLSAEDIAQRTAMPLAIIQQVLKAGAEGALA